MKISKFINLIFITLCVNIFSQSITFNYTGSPQTWVVPPCVTQINVTAAGAKGGGAVGGNGAVISATLTVTPGQTLNIYVGGMGSCGNNSGGWNGGATGFASNPANVSYNSCGGGGASDIRIGGNALGSRVMVAGGGGGKGGGSNTTIQGGASNCNNGANGQNSFGAGGAGGTQFSGGAGGTPWAGTPPGGSPGVLGNGGQGGLWQTASGGGGGGGYWGGGGGGNDGCCTGANGGGGGGAGSSLVPAGGSCLANNNNGNGYVTITWVLGTTINVQNGGPYCAGQTINLSATNGALSYQWSGPNGFQSNLQNPTIANSTPLDSGIYTLTYTSQNCNSSVTTLVVVNTPINPQFSAINPICQLSPVPQLPQVSNNNPPILGSWNPATISSQVVGTSNLIFTPNANFCANTAILPVTILPNETPTFNPINPICIGTQPPQLPNPSTNPTPYTGTWSPALISTALSGQFNYQFTPDAGQCAVTTQILVTILNYTEPTFVQIVPICQFTTGIQLPTSSTNQPAILGSWNPSQINTQTAGIFTYEFTPNPFQCADTASMQIVINPLIIPQFNVVSQVCQSDVGPNFQTVSNNGIIGTWTPPVIDSSIPGSFQFQFTPNPGQCADTIAANINIVPSIPPQFQSDTLSGCNPLQVSFTTAPVLGAQYQYFWNGNSLGVGNNISYMFAASGCHTITLEYNLLGCIETTTYQDYICIENYPNTSFIAVPNVLSSTSETIDFTNTTVGAINYFWEFGDGQTQNQFQGPHSYVGVTENILVQLTASTALGCSTKYQLTLPVISQPIYYVPNTFTPDTDEHNRTWYPVFTTGFDPYNFELRVYNRWGEVVWESHDSKAEWDGTWGKDGLEVQNGIYSWVIKYQSLETADKNVVSGFLNVLR